MTSTADPEVPPEQERNLVASDIRATRTTILARPPLRSLARRLASIAALLAIDVCGLALGLYLALSLRWVYYEHDVPLWGFIWDAETEWLPFLSLITILVFWQAGLYAEREHRAGVGRVVSSLVLVAVVTVVFAWGVDHEFGTYGLAPTAVVTCAAIIGLLRASYERVTRDLLHLLGVRRRALLVGDGDNLTHLLRTLGQARGGIDYQFVGAVAPAQDGIPLPRMGTLAELPSVLAKESVHELIVNGGDVTDDQLIELVEHAHQRGVQVRVAPTTAEILTQRAEYVPGQAVPLFELRPPVFTGVDWVTKRAFDLFVSALVVVLGLPLWLLIAAAIKLNSRGPVFYRDLRVGLGEREFEMIKFRTMRSGAEHLQGGLETQNEASGPLFKIRDDPRVTRVGTLLRRFSLDEVPQALNVLRGEMSLVGPRPLPIRDFEKLQQWHRKRYHVLPGITGLWQISGRSELTFDDLVRLDFYYLENWSIWMDITILLKTIPAVLGQKRRVLKIHPTARGFAQAADAYERTRPNYPAAAVDWIVESLELAPGSYVVDVGAGTGKFARELTARGLRVTGVEPIAEMRALFEQAVPAAEAVEGTAESIPLGDEVADAVTAAQAFHWFDPDRAPRELHRVLRPGHGVALIWNLRDESQPIQAALAETVRPYKGDDYPERGTHAHALEESPLFGDVEERTFTHSQVLDADGLVERSGSISFIAQLPDEERAELLERIRALAPAGTFEFPYVTKVFTCRRR